MKKLFLFFLFVSAAACLHAQQAAPGPAESPTPAAASGSPPVLPPGPLLKAVADSIRWTLTTTSKRREAASPSASPSQDSETGKPGEKEKAKGSTTMLGERIGKMAHVLTTKTSGGREEQWTDGTLLAVVHAGANAPVFTTERIETMPVPTWISRENFTDIKKQGDKSYLIFRSRILPSGLEIARDLEAEALGKAQNTEDLKVEATAVIDDDTRLPIAVTEGETTTTYKFEVLAPDTQIIPANIQTALAEHEKKLRELIRKPVRP